jgi:hypothetical protein
MKIEKIGTILKILHIRKIKPYAYFILEKIVILIYICDFVIIAFNLLSAISALEKSDTMGERIRRIGQIETDFF